MTNDELDTLAEIAKNVYKGHVHVKPSTVSKLKPFKSHLFKLGLKSVPRIKKRKIIQKGGSIFVPLLATIAGHVLSSLING